MSPWTAVLKLTPKQARILVSGPEGDLMKAVLPSRPMHPKALSFLLEGLALWGGHPLPVAISARKSSRSSDDDALFGPFGPDSTPLVRFGFVEQPRRRIHLQDFRDVDVRIGGVQ